MADTLFNVTFQGHITSNFGVGFLVVYLPHNVVHSGQGHAIYIICGSDIIDFKTKDTGEYLTPLTTDRMNLHIL